MWTGDKWKKGPQDVHRHTGIFPPDKLPNVGSLSRPIRLGSAGALNEQSAPPAVPTHTAQKGRRDECRWNERKKREKLRGGRTACVRLTGTGVLLGSRSAGAKNQKNAALALAKIAGQIFCFVGQLFFFVFRSAGCVSSIFPSGRTGKRVVVPVGNLFFYLI